MDEIIEQLRQRIIELEKRPESIVINKQKQKLLCTDFQVADIYSIKLTFNGNEYHFQSAVCVVTPKQECDVALYSNHKGDHAIVPTLIKDK